jgi:hypothetical protein
MDIDDCRDFYFLHREMNSRGKAGGGWPGRVTQVSPLKPGNREASTGLGQGAAIRQPGDSSPAGTHP